MKFRLPALFVSSFIAAFAASHGSDGLPNFQKVNDALYRGGQPDSEGFAALAQRGIKTVIDLRGSEHSEADEKRMVEAAGMKYVSIPMKGMHTPGGDDVQAALKLMNDASAQPVFIHCRRGADRTGAVVACYRIGHDHWDSDKALKEASGFGMSWYQVALRRYVDRYDGRTAPVTIPATILPAPAH